MGFLVIALIATGCSWGVQGEDRPALGPAASASPTRALATLTPGLSPAVKTVAFPDDLPVIAGTNGGDIYFQMKDGQPAGRKVHVCAGPISDLTTVGRQATFFCGSTAPMLYLYDDATGAIRAVVQTQLDGSGAALATTGVVYVTMGAAVPSAPIGMSKLVLLDLKTGDQTTIDERFGVAFDVWPTNAGVAVWRPQNSLSFRRPEAESGTWLLQGRTLTRLSLHRLIDSFAGRYLLESAPVDANGYLASSDGNTHVLVRTGPVETRLTPASVANEKGVAIIADGRIVTWQPDGPLAGAMIVYKDGAEVRRDRGTFSTFRLIRTGDWAIGSQISGAPSTTLRAYRFSDGAFASMSANSITSFAIFGSH